MKRNKTILAAVAFIALAALMLLAYFTLGEKAVVGSKFVTVEVVDDAGLSTVYEVHTDALYLQQAMDQADGLTFEFTEGAYGASVHTVNGLRADYTLDGAYWLFFVNGEYCNYGISQQPVEDGDRFQIVYTRA